MKLKLVDQDFVDAAKVIGCKVAAIKAVCEVEAPRGGFNADNSVVILFEGHIFNKYTKGKFANSHPTLAYPKWTTKHYGKTQAAEHARLDAAIKLDRTAALMSASWGKFQIMGFNFALCGFKSVQAFVNAMHRSEDAQLDAFIQYIIATGLGDELREERWADFARFYNGPLYYRNKYDTKMERAFNKWDKLEPTLAAA